ncbi:hypothetical protein E4K72_04545 [Oxalobacteraceae bacterium OM1]|nr:hypothetical protein E4K72_04545 [Oxalobacteraceae bacterium OM1]
MPACLPVTALPLCAFLALPAYAAMPDAPALGKARAQAAAEQYASIPHVVIIGKRMTLAEKRRQIEEERLAAQRAKPQAKLAER